MSFLLWTCLLVCVTWADAIPSFTRNYTSFQQLLPAYQIYWTVNETSQEIYLGFIVQTTGFLGFGIAEPASGSMPGADIMTASVTGNVTSITDRFSVEYAQPLVDEGCQDWQAVYGNESDGYTVVEVTRKLDTGDRVQDRVIPSGSIPVIFSYSADNSDILAYHGNNRGTGFITFYGIPQPLPSDLLQDPTINVSFPQISNFQIPPQQTTYICQAFELPIDQIRHIIAFEPMVNSTDPTMVHHGLVHGCTADAGYWTQYQTPGQCESPVGNPSSGCMDVLFGWARGGQPFFVPPEAGFRVSNFTNGGTYRILLQMHYDNPSLMSGAVDRSGFRLYMTTQLRPHDAGVLVLGDPETTSTPIPISTYTEYEYACSPTCTSQLPTPLNVFSSFPHMHMYGRRIWTTRWRNGVQLSDAVRTEYFAWTIQKNIPMNYTILPGDRFNTHCAYDTRQAPATVTFGKSSTQEMCMDFISYWPKQIGAYYCGAAHFTYTTISNNISLCGASVIGSSLATYEINNPSKWGFDPVQQHLREFGNEIPISNNLTCPIGDTRHTGSPTSNSTTTNTNTPTTTTTTTTTTIPTQVPSTSTFTPISTYNTSSTGLHQNLSILITPCYWMMAIVMVIMTCN